MSKKKAPKKAAKETRRETPSMTLLSRIIPVFGGIGLVKDPPKPESPYYDPTLGELDLFQSKFPYSPT